MVKQAIQVWDRFCAGFGLTESEKEELERAIRINRENDEAIEHGYSVASRFTYYPEIPGILERVRRGLENVFRNWTKAPR